MFSQEDNGKIADGNYQKSHKPRIEIVLCCQPRESNFIKKQVDITA